MRHVVVVGAGVMGLLTAIECVLAGHRVTVLDRGAIPDPRFDQHAAMRLLVPGDVVATRGMVAARRRWLALETLLGTRFYRRVGVVTAWPRERVAGVLATAIAAGVAIETVASERLPHFAVPAGSTCVLEFDAGVLLADRMVHAAAAWLAEHPSATVRPWCAATDDTADADRVLVAAEPVVPRRRTVVCLRPPSTVAAWWADAPAAYGLGSGGRGWVVPGAGGLLTIGDDGERPIAARVLSEMDRYTVVATRSSHHLTDGGFGAAPLVAGRIVDDMESCLARG